MSHVTPRSMRRELEKRAARALRQTKDAPPERTTRARIALARAMARDLQRSIRKAFGAPDDGAAS